MGIYVKGLLGAFSGKVGNPSRTIGAELGTNMNDEHVVTWPTAGRMEGNESDVVYVILYKEEKNDFFVFQNSVRGDGECIIEPEGLGTGDFHVWVMATSKEGDKRSPSRYLETITMAMACAERIPTRFFSKSL